MREVKEINHFVKGQRSYCIICRASFKKHVGLCPTCLVAAWAIQVVLCVCGGHY